MDQQSGISFFISRFRNDPPSSSEQRSQARVLNEEKIWWLDPASQAPTKALQISNPSAASVWKNETELSTELKPCESRVPSPPVLPPPSPPPSPPPLLAMEDGDDYDAPLLASIANRSEICLEPGILSQASGERIATRSFNSSGDSSGDESRDGSIDSFKKVVRKADRLLRDFAAKLKEETGMAVIDVDNEGTEQVLHTLSLRDECSESSETTSRHSTSDDSTVTSNHSEDDGSSATSTHFHSEDGSSVVVAPRRVRVDSRRSGDSGSHELPRQCESPVIHVAPVDTVQTSRDLAAQSAPSTATSTSAVGFMCLSSSAESDAIRGLKGRTPANLHKIQNTSITERKETTQTSTSNADFEVTIDTVRPYLNDAIVLELWQRLQIAEEQFRSLSA